MDKIIRFFLLTDTAGKKSWSLTLAICAFLVTTIQILIGGSSFVLSEGINIILNKPEPALIMAYFPMCLALYWKRRKDQIDENAGGK